MLPIRKLETTQSGYTLVELMVVAVIMSVLIITGYTAYRRFADRQEIIQAAGELVNQLRLIQKKADAGENASQCVGAYPILKGYFVMIDNPLEVYIRCTDSTFSPNEDLPTPIEIVMKHNVPMTTGDMVFYTLSRGAYASGNIILGSGSNIATVVVTPGGAISID